MANLKHAIPHLLSLLEQEFSSQQDHMVSTAFSPHLFPFTYEKVSVFVQEIKQQILYFKEQSQAPSCDPLVLSLLSQKIVAQFATLQEALAQQNDMPAPQISVTSVPSFQTSALSTSSTVAFTASANAKARSSTPQLKTRLLPPKEKLSLYYGYLQQFDQKLNKIQTLLERCQNPKLREHYACLLQRDSQRREACLLEIKNLEAYMAFIKDTSLECQPQSKI